MDIDASKIELAKMVLEIEDSELIEQVKNLITKGDKDFYGEFTEDEKLEVKFGTDQLDSGETISWEDFKSSRELQ